VLPASEKEISLSSHWIRFFRSIDLISRSTTGRQLSVGSQRRQRGKEERNSDLLVVRESGAPEEVDMAVIRKERDQGEERTGQKSDPARKSNPSNNVAIPLHAIKIVHQY
jgi:hypothetical protein